jgi:predicted secreted acid phosphatase
VNDETVLVREDGATASKESRREKVAARYRILLLVGDNLNDFSDDFAASQSLSASFRLTANAQPSERALSSFPIRCMETGKMLFTKTSRA